MDSPDALAEVFGLLDAINSDSSSATSVAEIDDSMPTPSSNTMQLLLKTPKLKKDRRRKEGPVRYTTSLQRRKKEELKSLREEAERLQAQLEQLQSSRLHHIGLSFAQKPENSHPSAWRSLAAIESEGRERAERTNRVLNSIMKNQMTVHASICKVLGRSDILEVY
ncbi:unnamed protein product [Phytophthora fragariaefolia]|uniref:Unnamed protein product n=1 Tax=Phytophthora fragariaefolia TaxID=1490495 RepID=A0A9W7D3D9_9STRA|nr:unnamed protein product [Phytophthora fragariaefolia]